MNNMTMKPTRRDAQRLSKNTDHQVSESLTQIGQLLSRKVTEEQYHAPIKNQPIIVRVVYENDVYEITIDEDESKAMEIANFISTTIAIEDDNAFDTAIQNSCFGSDVNEVVVGVRNQIKCLKSTPAPTFIQEEIPMQESVQPTPVKTVTTSGVENIQPQQTQAQIPPAVTVGFVVQEFLNKAAMSESKESIIAFRDQYITGYPQYKGDLETEAAKLYTYMLKNGMLKEKMSLWKAAAVAASIVATGAIIVKSMK